MTPTQTQQILNLYLQNVSRILSLGGSGSAGTETPNRTSATTPTNHPILTSGISYTQEPDFGEMSFTMALPTGVDPSSGMSGLLSILQNIPGFSSTSIAGSTTALPGGHRPLTHTQIQAATRTFVYNPDSAPLNDTTCPISQQEYNSGDILCEINSCKHVFKQGELFRWLDINSTCPVCRISLTRPTATAAAPTPAPAPAQAPPTLQRQTSASPPAAAAAISVPHPTTPTAATAASLLSLDEEALNSILNEAFQETMSRFSRS